MSENTKAAKAVEKVDADYSLEAVPESARKGFWKILDRCRSNIFNAS